MNRGYILPIIVVILAVTARNAVHSACRDCDAKCTDSEIYDRVACDAPDTNLYCECSSAGKGVERECFPNYHFDLVTQSCILKNSGTEVATGPVDCTGKPDGFKIISSDEACTKFIECPPQVPVTDQTCPTGKHLNPMIGECVPADTYVCDGTHSASSDQLVDCNTAGAIPSVFSSDKEDCAGYYFCFDGMRIKGKCDAQKYDFDPIEQRCSYKSGVCKPIRQSTSSPTGSNDIGWDTICKGKSGQFLADPRVCNAYIYCMSETRPRQDFCKTDTYFNNGFCSKTPPATCNCELYISTLSGSDKKYAADANDKRKFYICTVNGREEKTCPQGTVFNLKTKSCEL